jgi:hypothetical protein
MQKFLTRSRANGTKLSVYHATTKLSKERKERLFTKSQKLKENGTDYPQHSQGNISRIKSLEDKKS